MTYMYGPRTPTCSMEKDWFTVPEPTPPIEPVPAKGAVDESLAMLRIVEGLLALDVAARKRVLDYLVARFGG